MHSGSIFIKWVILKFSYPSTNLEQGERKYLTAVWHCMQQEKVVSSPLEYEPGRYWENNSSELLFLYKNEIANVKWVIK